MTIRDALRTAVLASNPYWPFSSINKYPYYIAIKAVARLCSSYAPIKSLYLRSGLVERKWVPGLSDIDFTIIIDSDLDGAEGFSFLQRFWRKFGSLKTLFPMLGEVDILPERYVRSWTRFGFAGFTSPSWRLIFGSETVPRDSYDQRRLQHDRIQYVLHWMEWYCRSYFAAKFFVREEAPGLLSQDLARLAAKIFRSLERHFPDAHETNHHPHAHTDEHEIFAQTIVTIEAAVRQLDLPNMTAEEREKPIQRNRLFLSEDHPAIRRENDIDEAIFAPWRNLVDSAMLDFNGQLYVVFQDDLEVEALAPSLASLRQSLGRSGRPITAVSRRVFTYMVRHYRPFEYTHLMRHRTLVFGQDLLLEIPTPTRPMVARFLLGQVPNILAFPQSREFHINPAPDRMAASVECGLFLNLYLEYNYLAPTPDAFLAEAESKYPRKSQALRDYRGSSGTQLHHDDFATFKALADTIDSLLESGGQ